MRSRFARGKGVVTPASERLSYRRLTERDLDAFLALVVDPHVRRFLLDGRVMDRPWCEAEVRHSDDLFDARGVGLWLVATREGGEDIGFCGFRIFEEHGPEPQLLYALREPFTGRGLATEAARACVRSARERGGFESVLAAVDAPNVASIRVLEKIGFERAGEWPGAFGPTYRFVLQREVL